MNRPFTLGKFPADSRSDEKYLYKNALIQHSRIKRGYTSDVKSTNSGYLEGINRGL